MSVGKLRVEGYKKALEGAGIKLDEKIIILSETEEDFDLKTNDFLDKNKVDAIFAVDEHASVMAMKMALKKGLKIPEEISIIGFADGLWSRRMTPSLSTISQHAPEIGRKTAELIIKRIEEISDSETEKTFETIVVKTELRKRDSVRKLA